MNAHVVTEAAVRYAPLLRELRRGGHPSASALAAAAGVIRNNLNRNLDTAEAEGLIHRKPADPSHVATLTPMAEAALAVLDGTDGGGSAAPLTVPLMRIVENPDNPRTDLDTPAGAAKVADRADSIAERMADGQPRGILQPILVRPAPGSAEGGGLYQVVAGNIRYRAACLAVNDGRLPSDFAVPVVIKDLTDDEAFEAAVIENLQRDDMHYLDEGAAFVFLNERLHYSAAVIQRKIGERMSKRSVQDYIQLARELPPEAKARARLDKLDDNYLSYENARRLVGNKTMRVGADLGDRVLMTLVEIAVAADMAGPVEGLEAGYVELSAKPKSGPVVTLQDKGLINVRAWGGKAYARPLWSEARKYLEPLDFTVRPHPELLVEARGRVVPKDVAAALPVTPWMTAELNPRPSSAAPDLEAGEALLARMAPDPPPAAAQLAPDQALAILELAHARVVGVQKPWGRVVEADAKAFADDDKLTDGLIKARLIFTSSSGRQSTIDIALTPTAEHWLDAQGLDRDGDQLSIVPEEALYAAQLAAHGRSGDLADGYMTQWLNPAEDASETPPQRSAHPGEGRDPGQASAAPKPSYQSPMFGQIKEALADDEPAPVGDMVERMKAEARARLEDETRESHAAAVYDVEASTGPGFPGAVGYARKAALLKLHGLTGDAVDMIELGITKKLDGRRAGQFLDLLRRARTEAAEALGLEAGR